MIRFPTPFVLATVAAAALLSACGGGDDDPSPTPLNAMLTVSQASDLSLDGVYSTSTVSLSDVEKINPIGGDPETCRFGFDGLQQAGSNRLLNGDIRYIPGNAELRVTFMAINGVEFRLQGTANASVDRANDRVNFAQAILTSTQNSNGNTITVTGSIPMRGGRPEGC